MKKFDQINVIPFIDIMLVLLAIVLTTATFIVQGKIPIDLPAAPNSSPLSANEKSVKILINAQSELFLDDAPVILDELDKSLSALAEDKAIELKVDSQVPFERFVRVVDLLKKYHLDNLSIITEKAN